VYHAVTKTLAVIGLFAAAPIVPANTADKMDFRVCKSKVMQDARYLSGKSRNICGTQCAAAIKRCMASGGKID
jgi:hypothetical protein